MKRLFAIGVALVGLSLVSVEDVRGQALFGPELMFGSDTDLGIGGRVVFPLVTEVPLDFQGGFDLFFPDGPADYWEVNANVWYRIPTRSSGIAVPYVGGGLNLGVVDRGSGFSSDTELGLNLGGGARFEFTNTVPFVEARFVLGGVEQFVIGGGFLFGSF